MKALNLINPSQYFEQMCLHDRIIVFGCGAKGRQAAKILSERGVKLSAACDNNMNLWGSEFIDGVIIQNPNEALRGGTNACVVITAAIKNALEIRDDLRKNNIQIPIYHLCNPFKVENNLLEIDNSEKFEDIYYNYELLADEESRKIYQDTINWKLSGDMFPLSKYNIGEAVYTFFEKEFIQVNKSTTYVDIGAYTGDSIESFLMFSGGKFKKIIGVEADEGNFAALNDFVRYGKVQNIVTYNEVLWSREEKKYFYTPVANREIHFDSPNLYESVDKIADYATLKSVQSKEGFGRKAVKANTLDKLLKDEIPDIIKINAIAADLDIILGSRKIIEKYRPTLILEYGVKREDVFKMIKTICNMNSSYKFYMRRKQIFEDIKTILYCI